MKLGRKERSTTLTEPHADGHVADSDTEGAHAARRFDAPEVFTETDLPLPTTEPFGELLVHRGLVSEEEVAQALIVQREAGTAAGRDARRHGFAQRARADPRPGRLAPHARRRPEAAQSRSQMRSP